MTAPRDSIRPYLWMVFGSLCFALMGNMAHVVGKTCDWQVVAVARSLIPLTLVGTTALTSGVQFVFFRPGILWMRSIAGSCSLVGTFFALTHLPSSDVFTVTNMFPLWVALLSWPMLGVFPSVKVWLAVFSGVAGVFLIQQPHLATGNSASLVTVAVSLFTALAMIGLHRLKGINTRAIVVHFSAVSLLFAVAACFVFERRHGWSQLAEGKTWLALFGVGATATAGQIFLTKAFSQGDPARVSVVGLTQIVFSLLVEAAFLHYPTSPAKLLGIPLVVAPTAWMMWQQAQLSPPPPAPLDGDSAA